MVWSSANILHLKHLIDFTSTYIRLLCLVRKRTEL